MSYDLDLHFKPGIPLEHFRAHLAGRKHYTVSGTEIGYQNPDTDVYFSLSCRFRRGLLSGKRVVAVNFEVNYNRSSYFGIEAEIELTAIVRAFGPSIEDPQIDGMDRGPYSGEGFLKGWNYGNALSVHSLATRDPDYELPTMPQSKLRAAWAWNYNLGRLCEQVGDEQLVPKILFVGVDGVPSTVAVWSLGSPIVLPPVDYVMMGREADGEPQFGLAPWAEVLGVLASAGIDVTGDPLDIEYAVTPGPIQAWFDEMSAIDLDSLGRFQAGQVIDDEVVEAGRRIEFAPPDEAPTPS